MMNALENKNIYISSQSACSGNSKLSQAVMAVTSNEELASSSLRISLSHLTTKEELDNFIEILKETIVSLRLK
ncbi:Cysteine desulfurase [compost metagenome]